MPKLLPTLFTLLLALTPTPFLCADSPEPQTLARPPIALLWSNAADTKPKDRLPDLARRSIALQGPEDFALEWSRAKTPGLSESFTPESISAARRNLHALLTLNPHLTPLAEIYFFEAEEKEYPADNPWWQKDSRGKRITFWPGCHNMDLANDDYVKHIAARAIATLRALDNNAGLYIDNLRFDPTAKQGWTKLLTAIRHEIPDARIVANAGWDSTDLEWVAPLLNGIMYEDAIAHTKNKNPEDFYRRIANTDKLLREPHLSINERFGPRTDQSRMTTELLRTLTYTNMSYLYTDSTNGHHHQWWPQYNLPLGQPLTDPITPTPAQLARRQFENAESLWLPSDAPTPQTLHFDSPMHPWGKNPPIQDLTLQPGEGILLIK